MSKKILLAIFGMAVFLLVVLILDIGQTGGENLKPAKEQDATENIIATNTEEQEKNILKVSIITDIDHCPSRSSVPEKMLNQFISFSKKENIDFVISLGDNASHGLRNCSETGDRDAHFIADRIRETGKPCFFVLGDHDISSDPASYCEWLKTIGKDETYFSFDFDHVHVIVLDSVLGGEKLSYPCEEVESCSNLKKRLKDLKSKDFTEYRKIYRDSLSNQEKEKKNIKQIYDNELDAIKATRSVGRRDKGRISQKELDWLSSDIAASSMERILVFSDHPLFPFISERKAYNIVNGDKVRKIFEKSNKQIVCISGEAHLWYEEKINGIQYYIIDQFREAQGSWALFSWDESEYILEKITHL